MNWIFIYYWNLKQYFRAKRETDEKLGEETQGTSSFQKLYPLENPDDFYSVTEAR